VSDRLYPKELSGAWMRRVHRVQTCKTCTKTIKGGTRHYALLNEAHHLRCWAEKKGFQYDRAR